MAGRARARQQNDTSVQPRSRRSGSPV